eukprot:TRINITY_DN59223_c0_g1_i1.p1 TRINITY_DN59223_c0_g1~~TRINITY_DN59223_c0_g1_i1.p1  ORF type:complete len:738 (+),score=236.55 TRINITY_DN59223_c0_g1_i1:95-2308(+)
MAVGVKRSAFLLNADLADPDERKGRRKRAREKKDARAAKELPAEKRPRSQQQWDEQHRSSTKLATVGGGEPLTQLAKSAPAGGDGVVGRKKQKRLSLLEAKRAQKAQKKVVHENKATEAAADALKSKAKKSTMSQAAADMLERCKSGPDAEQRLLAIVCERIAGAPEKELELFDVLMHLHSKGSDKATRQFALLSAVQVFRDLVPGYKIREPTEQEKAMQRSKPVLALERYELGLLGKYRNLLPALEAGMKGQPQVYAPALAALVQSASEFNYRQRLIGTCVRHASCPVDSVRRTIADGLRGMVEADQRLEASREVVLAVGRVAQGAAFNASRGGGGEKLKSELVEVLLRLPIGKAEAVALNEGALDADPDEDVRRGMLESSINQTAKNVKKNEVTLITEVFIVYLRILRQRQAHDRQLLAACLTGLSKWGQQVNVELLLEILTELRGAVEDAITRGDELVSLRGLNCALVLLSGPSQALMTDVTWLAEAFKTSLTLSVASLCSAHSEERVWPPARCFSLEADEAGATTRVTSSSKELQRSLEESSVPSLVLRCLEAALKCPQAYGRATDATLAVLIEQLFALAVAADAHVGFALLREASALLRRHRQLWTLLDTDGGLFGLGGVTQQAVSVVWHLQPLAFSLTPEMTKAARAIPSTIPHRRANLSELFPSRDWKGWLASEVAVHLGAGLTDGKLTPPGFAPSKGAPAASAKGAAAVKPPRPASFLTEAQLRGSVRG